MKLSEKVLGLSILIILFSVFILIIVFRKQISELKDSNEKRKETIDSLHRSNEYVEKLSEFQLELLENENKGLKIESEKYEEQLDTLISSDVYGTYEENLRTIKQYLKDRDRYLNN